MPIVRPRARDLGIRTGVLPPGPLNAITDIAGVRVGHCTVWEGESPGEYGSGPARTGVTAIVPPGDYFGECDDSFLNVVAGFHVREEHVVQALENASVGPVTERTVGSATGLHCFDFKGGIGSSSRQLPDQYGGYTVGGLVNTNFGKRDTPQGLKPRSFFHSSVVDSRST